ncbi:hypothetical protein [Cupriavidus sp. AcVe19-6a]|uniref:hypothetical protein n=1 Tax=Cupriavidus sp. AcVe19-6a TaxID=2821358 RepID=UPI001AE4C32B|nr:hypothetical protein [Cupriavidus sp. AcVe19-6a]MBP0638016.1 hypothetical protein [Cupriavidus sp. AcVe19-6a]
MTIDIVVTMLLPPDFHLHYHGIDVKSAKKETFSDKEKARLQREKEALGKLGWTWQLMLSNPYQAHELSNCLVMFRTIRDQDVVGQYNEAHMFADYLLTRSTEGRMSSVMSRVAKQLGISVDRAHQLFAIAVSFGMLRVDHTQPLMPDKDLHLLR